MSKIMKSLSGQWALQEMKGKNDWRYEFSGVS